VNAHEVDESTSEGRGIKDAMKKAGLLFIFLVFFSGCSTFWHRLPPLPENAIKPVVAVTEFKNETGFSGQWKLGRGISDMIVSELLKTGRLTVVDRKNLNLVVGEIMRQGRDLFRKEDSVARGRLKNARYLIRGVITDFTQTRSASGWFRIPKAGVGLSGARAMVMISITVIDVETGEIICSIPSEGSARASSKWVKFDYNNTSFGGDLFLKSPIGRATQEAVREAVFYIVQKIPYTTWKPRIAEALLDSVVINCGKNVGINIGSTFDVRDEGRPITDPFTGDVIDMVKGKIVGRIRITSVHPNSAEGVLLSGTVKRGYYLEKVK